MDSQTFDTMHCDPDQRVDAWRHANRRFFGDLKVEALGDGPLDARMRAFNVGKLRMFQIETPAHRVGRSEGCGELPTDDYYKLVLQLSGRAEIWQREGAFALFPGDWSLYDPRVPYSITNFEPSRLLVVQVPRAELQGFRVPNLHTCEAKTSSLAGLYSVLGGVLKSLSEQLPMLSNGVGGAVSDTVLSLIASTLSSTQESDGGPLALPEVLKARIKQFIAAHLADEDLGVDRLARALHCSKRYVHRVFEDEDCSVERFIWQSRLERCHAALSAESSARRGVSEIAFRWGFNSSAHFSRLFRARYGVAPSALRRATLAGAPGRGK